MFKATVLRLFEDPAQLEAFIAYVSTCIYAYQSACQHLHIPLLRLGSAAAAARQGDTASLKRDILTYIPEDPNAGPLTPTLTKHDPKSARGFNYIATASCLCPMDKYEIFCKDQQ